MEETPKEPSPIEMILYVVQNDKKEPSQNWEIIPNKKYIVGRSKKEADISINEKLLSRKHAEIVYYDNTKITVKDLDSRNGTFLNKVKVEPSKDIYFNAKDVLSFGTLNNEVVFFNKNEKKEEEEAESGLNKNKKSENEDNAQENKSNNENKTEQTTSIPEIAVPSIEPIQVQEPVISNTTGTVGVSNQTVTPVTVHAPTNQVIETPLQPTVALEVPTTSGNTVPNNIGNLSSLSTEPSV